MGPLIPFAKLALYLILAPTLGGPVLVLIAHSFGVCTGALGSGVECGGPFADYLRQMSQLVEVSMMVLVGFLWFVVAIFIWVKLAFWAIAAVTVFRQMLIDRQRSEK
ncbi:hypothetical protein [Aliiroseovarius sp. 2305UL8-7]|uniref:hypothetical protein n=1 Tax=Aliiroseovarius conchicola TaxID=3121637 RepID=UPI0035299125